MATLCILDSLFGFHLDFHCVVLNFSSKLGAEPPFVFSLIEKEKKRLWLNRVKPLRSPKPELNWSILSFLLKLVFRQRTFFINITIIVTELAVQVVLLLGLGFCILATCRSHSISFFIPPRCHAFNSVRLSCARKKGIGVENDPIYAVFLEYDKIKQAKETLCSQGAIPGKLFTTIRNIVEAVIC